MELEELETTGVCIACGATIDETVARSFAYGEDGLLCWSCALGRGGVFDIEQDRWVTAPDLEGLPDARAQNP